MNDISQSWVDPQDDPSEIESMIRRAGDFVQPSRDFRPTILEAARLRCSDVCSEHKLAAFSIAALLLMLVLPPLASRLRLPDDGPFVSSSELLHHADHLSSQPEVGSQWGLTQAYLQLRQFQADRLRGSGSAAVRWKTDQPDRGR